MQHVPMDDSRPSLRRTETYVAAPPSKLEAHDTRMRLANLKEWRAMMVEAGLFTHPDTQEVYRLLLRDVMGTPERKPPKRPRPPPQRSLTVRAYLLTMGIDPAPSALAVLTTAVYHAYQDRHHATPPHYQQNRHGRDEVYTPRDFDLIDDALQQLGPHLLLLTHK